MATTTNYGWTTPDDTALVKDGAAAIRTLGSSVDTTTKALNPSTTLGDIEYRSSTANTNTRLGIGTTGQVLTVAGGVPSWGAAPSAGANWSLLNSGGTSLTAAQTITVSGISGADKIMVLLSGASSANTFSFIGLRLNTDTGSNYYQYGTYVEPKSTYGADMYSTYNGTAAAYFTFSRTGTSAAALISGDALITGCNSAGVKIMQSDGASTGTGTDWIHTSNGGYYNSSSVITSISIYSSSGNFDAGTVFVYTSA
jgi:hypothetical protein